MHERCEPRTMDDVNTEKPKSSADSPKRAKEPEAEVPAERRLYRSRKNRVFKGVAGGIGEYFGIDPVLVRLAFLLTFAMGGVGVIAYILAWVLLPKRPKGQAVPPTPRTSGLEVLHNRSLGVWILVAIGAGLILDQLNLNIAGDRLWPLLLIGGGLIVLMRRRDAGAGTADPGMATIPGGASGRTSARTSSAESTMSIFDGGPSRRDLHAEALAELHDPVVDELDRAVAELRAERLGSTVTEAVGPQASSRRGDRRAQPRSLLRRFLIGSVLFVALLTLLTAAVGFRILARGVGERQVAYAGQQSFRQTFGAGDLTVDLTGLEGAANGDSKHEISLDFGQATIRLPAGSNRPKVKVTTHGRIVAAQTGFNGATEATLFGSRVNTFPGCPGGGTVDVDLTIMAGEVGLIPDTTTKCSPPPSTEFPNRTSLPTFPTLDEPTFPTLDAPTAPTAP